MSYLHRLATAMQQLESTPGTIATVHVQHDSHCPMLAGKKTCRCKPDITIETPGAKINVMPDETINPTQLN